MDASKIKVTFYGTRGSIPVPEKAVIQLGGNTACVLVTFDNDQIVILDSGTGIRRPGHDLVARGVEQFANIYRRFPIPIWTTSRASPSSSPPATPGGASPYPCAGIKIRKKAQEFFSGQMRRDYFPVPMDDMGARFTFCEPDETDYTARSGIRVQTSLHTHPIETYGYRFEEKGKVLVYVTDMESECKRRYENAFLAIEGQTIEF